jgi:hypothetical protein
MPLPDWERALASAKPGARYRIIQLVFAMVRDQCRELGLGEGDEVECVENRSWSLLLERSDGRKVVLQRDYAWFVQVDLLDGRSRGGGARDDAPATDS